MLLGGEKQLTLRAFFQSLAVAASLFLSAAVADGQPAAEPALVALRALDGRVATIGHRLAVANVAWCRDRSWLAGVALHHLSQYAPSARPAAIRAFGLDAGAAVLALAAAGPAERGGLRVDDIVEDLDGFALPRIELSGRASFSGMDQILAVVENSLADGAATFRIQRAGERIDIPVTAERGCASRFQLIPSRSLNAYADGRYVQVTAALAEFALDDAELAAVLAHELAHNMLGHRARLDAAGVRRGLLASFGRNARLIRETEVEADRLSIWLLDRAGYDPGAASRFWTRFGRHGLNFIGSPTHGGWRTRVAAFEAEIASIRRGRANGEAPRPDFLPELAQP